MNDLITIIVPVYNVEKYIEECIQSIINQSYNNIEIILIDDGSTDSCGKICDEYKEKDNRIKVIHKENGGVSSARNLGIEYATGKWVSFVDGDDWIDKEFCEKMIKIAKEKSSNIVLCGYNRVSQSGIEKINSDGKVFIVNSREYLINSLNPQTGFGFCHMKLYNISILKNMKFNEKLKVGEDALFNQQISEHIEKAVFLKENIYNYRVHSNSVVRKFDANYVKKFKELMIVNREFIYNSFKDDVDIKTSYFNFVAFHVLLIAVNYCFNKENPRKDKINMLKEICNYEDFKEGIRKSNYKNLRYSTKIALFTIKHKLYLVTDLICRYRQRQNNKGS